MSERAVDHGWSPMKAGLANLPIIVAMIAASPLSDWLGARFGSVGRPT